MEEIYKNQDFWTKLTKKQKAGFCDQAKLIQYEKKAVLSPYESDIGCMFIQHGTVSVILLGEDVETELERLGKNDCCVICLQDILPFDTDKISFLIAPDTEVFALPRREMVGLLHGNVYFELYMNKTCLRFVPPLLDAVEMRDNYSLERKISSFLLQESALAKSTTIAVTHSRIASRIGASREAVTRKLREMADQGLIECKRGSILLRDKARLKREYLNK